MRIIYNESLNKNLEILTFLYDSNDVTIMIKRSFRLIELEGVGFIPFLLYIERSKGLIKDLNKYIKLEEKLAKEYPFTDLGMGILIVARPLKGDKDEKNNY